MRGRLSARGTDAQERKLAAHKKVFARDALRCEQDAANYERVLAGQNPVYKKRREAKTVVEAAAYGGRLGKVRQRREKRRAAREKRLLPRARVNE